MNCQDYIKRPEATDESVAAYQAKYARRLPNDKTKLPKLRGPVPRIGYHCSFMDSDTIRYQIAPWLRERHRKNFEVIGYAPRFPTDMQGCFDLEVNTSKLTDEQFTKKIRNDCIDILIELSGFSPGHRFGAMARRAAPVQISYLNHPGTTGVENVDYLLTDETAFNGSNHYTEKPYFIDDCFFCFDYRGSLTPEIEPPPCILRGFITYGSMGSMTKINRDLVRLWSAVLNKNSKARFRLQNAGMDSWLNRAKVQHWFASFGIDKSRIDLVRGTSRYQLLKAYAGIDVQLDTWPYCGGNTIAESFWMGVPVVTLQGDRFSSAYGSSLVAAAGYPEMIAHNTSDYADIAASIRPAWLWHERKLTRSKGFMLNDSRAFARKMEKMYGDVLCGR